MDRHYGVNPAPRRGIRRAAEKRGAVLAGSRPEWAREEQRAVARQGRPPLGRDAAIGAGAEAPHRRDLSVRRGEQGADGISGDDAPQRGAAFRGASRGGHEGDRRRFPRDGEIPGVRDRLRIGVAAGLQPILGARTSKPALCSYRRIADLKVHGPSEGRLGTRPYAWSMRWPTTVRRKPLPFAQLQPLVAPQVLHLRQVPLRTRVKLPHSPQASPS